MRKLTCLVLANLMSPAAIAGDIARPDVAAVVDTLISAMDGYLDPATGKEVIRELRKERGELLEIDDRTRLADALNRTLAASHDLHLKVSVNTVTPPQAEPDRVARKRDAELLEGRLAHGLMAIRRLPGNIGYLKLRFFAADSMGGAMIDAAMGLLRDTDALIIDLRENTGGGGSADSRLLGHLSDTDIPMAVIHWRRSDGSVEVEGQVVSKPAEGAFYPDRPVFVLTAQRTFSAAEAVAYDLQAAGRATIMGERTRGGGNPSDRPVTLGSGMSAFVPNGRVVHPVTGGNWEGTGVVPDVEIAAEGALVAAYARALAVAKPLVETPKSRAERENAMADPRQVLSNDQRL